MLLRYGNRVCDTLHNLAYRPITMDPTAYLERNIKFKIKQSPMHGETKR